MPDADKININELALIAEKLEALLISYSSSHKGAHDVLSRHKDLITKAKNKEITQVNYKGFLPEEMLENGNLFELTKLCETAAQFSILLKGWASLEHFHNKINNVNNISEQEEKEFREKHE